MRKLLLCSLLALAATPAAASSILHQEDTAVTGQSFEAWRCVSCPDAPATASTSYVTPVLKHGVESAKIADWYGSADLIRIDKFMGGSPIRTISKAQVPLMEELRAANEKIKSEKLAAQKAILDAIDENVASRQPPDNRNLGPGVDTASTTAAVDNTGETVSEFSAASFDLRLK